MRNDSGQFAAGGKPGPGRGKKRELYDSIKRAMHEEDAVTLSGEIIPAKERVVQEVRVDIETMEARHEAELKPLYSKLARAEIDLSRAHTALVVVGDKHGVRNVTSAADKAVREHAAIVNELSQAREQLLHNPDPGVTAYDAVGDADLFDSLERFNRARILVADLSEREIRLRARVTSVGGLPVDLPWERTIEDEAASVGPYQSRRREMQVNG